MDFYERLKQLRDTFEKLNKVPQNTEVDLNTEELYEEMKHLNKVYTYLLSDYKKYYELKKELSTYTDYIVQLSRLQNLNQKQKDRIQELIEQYTSTRNQRDALQQEMRQQDQSSNQIAKYENEIQEKLKEIVEMAQNEKFVYSRINELQGSIEGILYDREYLQNKQRNIYHLSILCIILLSTISFILVLLAAVYRMDILFYATIAAAVTILGGALLYVSRRNTLYELKKLGIEEQKVRKELKKEKIKLFNATNYLQYQYKKYKVKDITALEKNYFSYKDYKRKIEKYKNTVRRLGSIEGMLLSVLEEIGVEHLDFMQGDLSRLLHLEMQQDQYEKFTRRKSILEDRIAKMDEDRILLEDFLDHNVREYAKHPVLKKMVEQYERELKEIEGSLDKD